MEGKVTFPIALAMKYIDKAARQKLWSTLKSKPQDKESVKAIVDIVRGTITLEESRKIAVDMVEASWAKASPTIPDSFSKAILRRASLFIWTT